MRIIQCGVLFSILLLIAVGLNAWLRDFTLAKRWQQCRKEAGKIVAGVQAQYPGCEHAVCAVTTAPGITTGRSRSTQITEEQWVNSLDMVDPAVTPMMSFAENEVKLGAVEFKKNVDGFPSPKGALGRSDNEAAPASGSTLSQDVTSGIRLMGNIGQGFAQTWRFGWIAAQLSHIVGMDNKLAAAKERYYKLMKIEQETAMCSLDQTALDDVSAGLGAIGAGYAPLVVSSNAYTAVSAFGMGKAPLPYAAPASAVVTGALSAVHNRAMYMTVALALRRAAKRNTDFSLLAGLGLNQAISDLTNPTGTQVTAASGVARSSDQVRVYMREENDNILGVMVDTIKTPNGRFFVVPVDYLGTTTTTSAGSAQATAWANTTAGRSAGTFIAADNAGLIVKKGNVFKMWGITPDTIKLGEDGAGDAYDTKSLMAWGVRNPILAGVLNLT